MRNWGFFRLVEPSPSWSGVDRRPPSSLLTPPLRVFGIFGSKIRLPPTWVLPYGLRLSARDSSSKMPRKYRETRKLRPRLEKFASLVSLFPSRHILRFSLGLGLGVGLSAVTRFCTGCRLGLLSRVADGRWGEFLRSDLPRHHLGCNNPRRRLGYSPQTG